MIPAPGYTFSRGVGSFSTIISAIGVGSVERAGPLGDVAREVVYTLRCRSRRATADCLCLIRATPENRPLRGRWLIAPRIDTTLVPPRRRLPLGFGGEARPPPGAKRARRTRSPR